MVADRKPLPLIHGVDELEWQTDARCQDAPHFIFFLKSGEGNGYDAKRVCHRCPVIDLCLEYALETRQQYGVWGGMSAKERRAELRRRRFTPA